MPLYEYQCDSCSRRFELIRKFSDPPLEVCPTCGGPVHKLVSSPAFQFKGSGWYITDYARKDQPAQSKSEESKTTSQDKEKDGKAGDKSDKSDKSDKADSAPSTPATPASPSAATKTS